MIKNILIIDKWRYVGRDYPPHVLAILDFVILVDEETHSFQYLKCRDGRFSVGKNYHLKLLQTHIDYYETQQKLYERNFSVLNQLSKLDRTFHLSTND